MRKLKSGMAYDVLVPDRFAFAKAFPNIALDSATIDDYMTLTLKGEQPVSYTHLFGKLSFRTERHVNFCAISLAGRFTAPRSLQDCSLYVRKMNGSVHGRPLSLKQVECSTRWRPVSYTHLDVYKRQGIFIAWAIGHRKKMMECSAEAIWYAIIGCSTSGICAWIAYATGLWPDCWLFSLFGPGITVWAGLWLACFICFIFLSVLWIYGLRTKMSDPERAYVMKGDDHFAPGTRTLRYDGGITVNALPETIWPYMQQAGQSKGG